MSMLIHFIRKKAIYNVDFILRLLLLFPLKSAFFAFKFSSRYVNRKKIFHFHPLKYFM